MELSLLMGMISVSTVVMIIDHGDRKILQITSTLPKSFPWYNNDMILIIMAMMAMIQIDCSCGPGSTKGPFPDLVTLPISEEDTQGGYRRHHHYHHHHHHCLVIISFFIIMIILTFVIIPGNQEPAGLYSYQKPHFSEWLASDSTTRSLSLFLS